MLMQKKPKDAKRNQDTLAFFWAFENGQAQANEPHVPLPAELVKQIEAYWATDRSDGPTVPARAAPLPAMPPPFLALPSP